jgi:hypothetical protein
MALLQPVFEGDAPPPEVQGTSTARPCHRATPEPASPDFAKSAVQPHHLHVLRPAVHLQARHRYASYGSSKAPADLLEWLATAPPLEWSWWPCW